MYGILKRLFDLIAAASGILVLLPLSLPIFLALRLTGEGEVFYRQARIGHKGKPFQILKLATMLKNSLNLPGGSITLRGDPRITPLGGFLRKSKLNELPQLWNVLVGDMTIVGPRPLVPAGFALYSSNVQAIISHLKPGLTGIASLIFRDEEGFLSASNRDPAEFYREVLIPYKSALELWYAENQSFRTDLKILALTAWLIIMPSSDLTFRWFPTLPLVPDELAKTSFARRLSGESQAHRV